MIKFVQKGTKLEDLSKVKAGEGDPEEPGFIGGCGSIHACLNCGFYNEKQMNKSYMDWMKVDF